MSSSGSEIRDGIASRLNYALRNHRDLDARGWGIRDLTRAVAHKAGVTLKDDSGARWFKGSQPRDPEIAIALAEVLEVDPGWLYFGEASQAPAPGDEEPAPRLPSAGRRKRLLEDDTDVSEVA